MNAVILMWNPEISSFKKEDFLNGMKDFDHFRLNWSIWEYEKVQQYDRFFMVRVGGQNTGIVMSGLIVSEPYKGKDWSGKGREVYYVDLRPSVMVDPDSGLLMTSAELSAQIPGFDWTGGHSGRVLSEEDSVKLMNLWELHQDEYLDGFKNQHLAQRNDNDFDAAYKLYSMKAFLKDYAFEVHTSADEGYDYLDDVSYCITLRNADGEELFIDLESEFTLSYGGWHTHYLASNSAFESLKEDILAILTNKFGAVTLSVDGKWMGSSTTTEPITQKEQAIEIVLEVLGDTKEFLRKVHRKGVEVSCKFWDSELDSTTTLAPGEVPLPTQSWVQIDLRPHSVFAYYVEGSMVMNKSLLYYSRKDKALHYKYEAGISYLDERKDMERTVPISDEDAKALERVFRLMVYAVQAYKGEPGAVLDGSEYVVISGRRRVRFVGPLDEPPYGYVNSFGDRLLEIMENWNPSEFAKLMKQVPDYFHDLSL
ncbi:MAG: hypothetical protein IJ615_05965 [Bacteroidaceae bacterium]|nr:hypothetical protein [Bacteroidaceae bacterium]